MTNKEKFIEIMNQTFNAGITEDDIDIQIECPPVWGYKLFCPGDKDCDACRNWWSKEYKEMLKNA